MPVSDDHHRDPAKRGGHRDDGHEEEILQPDSETKKKVTNNGGYINLNHHQRIRTRMNKYWIIGMDEGEGRREKGEGRKEKGERRKEKGERRKEKQKKKMNREWKCWQSAKKSSLVCLLWERRRANRKKKEEKCKTPHSETNFGRIGEVALSLFVAGEELATCQCCSRRTTKKKGSGDENATRSADQRKQLEGECGRSLPTKNTASDSIAFMNTFPVDMRMKFVMTRQHVAVCSTRRSQVTN